MIAPLTLARRVAAALPVLGLSAGLAAQQPAPPAPPAMATPPADAVPTNLFSLPDDLEVTLWAKAPMLRNPSNMDIDAQGRVWITEAVNYRKLAGKDPEGDRVIILEDTNGDGVADKTSVFVQEPALLAPLGIAVIDNKIIVSCAPDIIVYTDVDRDGKFDARIDKREVLLTGFNGRNHDHSLHSVTFGPDGKFYFNHGNCSAQFTDRSGRTFRIGSTYDPKGSGAVPIYNWNPKDLAGAASDDGHVYTGGFTVRMNPDGTNAEVIGYNYRNSYEQTVTSFGDVFHNDNDDPPAARTSFLMEYGNAGFFSRDGRRTWQADKRPGQTTAIAEWRQQDPGTMPVGDVYGNGAPTGIVSYEGDALGAKWRGVLLSCETARNVVFGYFPKADGAGYKLERFDFFTSNSSGDFAGIDSQRGKTAPSELKTWFRPSDVAVGPDGAIYVADWFDPRTGGHSALDASFSGAIYRITPKGKKLTTPKLDVTTTAGQIAALKSPAVNVRALGFNALKAQGANAVPAVAALLDDENPYVRARAIFLLAQLGAPGIAKVEGVLQSTDAQQRIAAFRALRRAGQPIIGHARKLAADASPAVRREVALALRDTPAAQAKDILLTVAKGYDGSDRAYLEAWGTGCSGKEAEIYAALAATAPAGNAATWPAKYANLIWRLTPRGAEAAFAARAAAESLPEADRIAAITALGFISSREAVTALLDLAEKGKGAVKNHAFWWVINYKDIRWKDYGVDAALKQRGLYDPAAATVAEMVVPAAPESKLPPVADIAKLRGDIAKGEAAAARCLVCHRIGDQGVDYAPALTGFAKAQTTEVVINAIVNPSAEIAHGYEGTQVTLKDGSVVHGLMLSSGDPLVIQSMGGVTQLIPGSKVRNKSQLGRSLMLSADQLNLSAQEVADIVAYLKTK
jgi:putative membrane-bound dehydrogenase-like protein